MTRVWELGRCASDGAGERTWLDLGVVVGRFGRGVGAGVCLWTKWGPTFVGPSLGFLDLGDSGSLARGTLYMCFLF